MDRIYDRSDKRSGVFDFLAWADEHVLFAEAKHGGKDALRPSQKTWIEAALDEGVALGSLLVVEWGFGGEVEEPVGDSTTRPVKSNDGSDSMNGPLRGASIVAAWRSVRARLCSSLR